ncbi:MAG: response regulator [Reichenbachiella sp.]
MTDLPIILIVENNSDLRLLLRDTFSDSYLVAEAANGQKGYEKCLELNPRLVISDVMMPIMDGFELCEKIKSNENTAHIPVLLLTAHTEEDAQITGFTKGADAYVSKPFNVKILESRVNAIINSREKLKAHLRHPKPSKQTTFKDSEDAFFINSLIKIIVNHMNEPDFTSQQLVHEYGSNRVSLNARLKKVNGHSANSFIRSIRLKRAAELLLRQKHNISQITYMVGFKDKEYFRNCFKNEFQQTPSQYQKNGSSFLD